MDQTVTYFGVWWLPETPNAQIPGSLTFSPDAGASIETIGTLTQIPASLFDLAVIKVIVGVATDGKLITLRDCQQTDLRLTSAGLPSQKLRVDVVLIGGHLETPDAIRFSSIHVHFSNLDEWYGLSGFTLHYNPDLDARTIEHVEPPPAMGTIDDDVNLMLETEVTGPTTSVAFPQTSAEIRQRAFAIFQATAERPLDLFLGLMYRFQQFLTLGVGQPSYALEVFGFTQQVAVTVGDRTQPTPVYILFHSMPRITGQQHIRPGACQDF